MNDLDNTAMREEYVQKVAESKRAYDKGDLKTAAALLKETCDFGIELHKEEKVIIDMLKRAQNVYESKPRSPITDRDLQLIMGARVERQEQNDDLIKYIMGDLDQKYDTIMKRIG